METNTIAAVTTHAVADGSAACGATPSEGWGALYPVHGSGDATCPACLTALTKRYMAAIPLNTRSEPR
jgi:hypothetical protein